MLTVTEQSTFIPAAITPGYAKRVTQQRNLTEHVNWAAVRIALAMLVCTCGRLGEAVPQTWVMGGTLGGALCASGGANV
jgi:hypothetical protein